MTFLLFLSLYSAILSTILFIRWMRLLIIRGKIRKQLRIPDLLPQNPNLTHNTLLTPFGQAIKDIEEELDGEVVRGFEIEMEREEGEGIEETVEEREWQEEEKIRQQRKGRGK